MKKIVMLLVFLSLTNCLHAQGAAGVRVILGLTDTAETKWDGSASARGTKITGLEPWRFEKPDALLENNSWRISTHPIRLFGGQAAAAPRPVVANGVIVWLDSAAADAELQIQTAQGNFSVRLGEIPYGVSKKLLDGRAMVDRVPSYRRLTESADEQDYPAAATAKDGSVWIAWMEFKHHPDHNKLRANMTEAPANFDRYKEPPGGDQIFARRYAGGRWGDPIAVTPPGGHLYRPAVAIDGSGKAWVFWPARQGGNFDLWACPLENGKPGALLRITSDAGADIDPVATADSNGRVWVAWQGWRNGKGAIFAASQSGGRFSRPAALSSSSANEWNPAIASSLDGRITVAWDSYRNGNYDVMVRTASNGDWGKETSTIASPRYEAYPSVAYDPTGRLWLAYEEGSERWGKDFGADETSGIALYKGRAIRLLGYEKDGRVVQTTADIDSLLPGLPAQRVDSAARQNQASDWLKPSPDLFKKRPPSQANPNAGAPRNTMPRLLVDSSGRLWLAFRSMHPIWWNPLGTVWTEYVVSCEGGNCMAPVFLTHSDNLLDNRPALASPAAGRLLVVGSSDNRRQFHLANVISIPEIVTDPHNNDLYANEINLGAASAPIAVKPGAAPTPGVDPDARKEASAVATLRKAKIKSAEGDLRIIRGEFHRHSEVSMDGGNDGTLIDQWRYMVDPADMDWVGCCDHDNGGGREYSWWITQKLTDVFHTPGRFVSMFSYERSLPYPEGHRNVVFAQPGIRNLPRLPRVTPESTGNAPDTQMLYRYLKQYNGIVAMHTSGTNMGTDWRDNDPIAEPVVEIYQGLRQNYEMPDAPRSNNEKDSIGGWRPKGFVSLALDMGYKMSFQASSDHVSTHMSYCNILAKDLTRESLLDAFHKRHVYGATDDILADFRSGSHIMGDAFSTPTSPELSVRLVGTAPFARVHVIKDNKYVYTAQPSRADVSFTWRDQSPTAGKTSYYYIRGEQQDGEVVWVSPMWITYTGK